MSSISFPSLAAQVQPALQVSVDLALAGSPDAAGAGAVAASKIQGELVAELVNAVPLPSSGGAQAAGSIISTYA